MTAQEARKLMPVKTNSLKTILELVKYYAIDGSSKLIYFVETSEELTPETKDELKQLGYVVNFNMNENGLTGPYYEISWE